MSHSKEGEVEKDNSLSIPEILADFFLRKIDMPSHSDDSDHKHKNKRKKSKHKKRKHKKSKHKHRSRSGSTDTSSKTSNFNSKVVDDVSSSEEMGIKRLKKIKSLKLQSVGKSVPQPAECDTKDKSNSLNSTSETAVFYGPSLELLLSGVESNNSNSKSNDVSKLVVSKENKNVDLKSDLDTSNKSNESEGLTVKPENQTSLNSSVSNTVNPDSVKKDSFDNVNNDKPCVDANNPVSISENNSKSVKTSEMKEIDIQKEPPEKSSINVESSSNKESKSDSSKNDSSAVTSKDKSEKKKKHSKSRSRSRSRSKHSPPKSKHRRQTSRSSSRDSYNSRKKKRYSRSHSHGRVHERRRRSYSRSRSRSRYPRRRITHSRSPHDRYYRRRPRSRSHSYTRHRKRSESKTRRRSRSKHRDHSLSRSKHRDRSLSKSKHRDRSLSRSKHRNKSSRRSLSRSRSKSKSRSRHASPSKEKSRSRSKEKKSSQSSTKIDQAKVLETARKNVLKMMKNGTLPEGLPVENIKKEQLISIQAGGKSVQELTDFCQRLSQKENEPDASENEDNEEKLDEETGFIHHPFKVKEPGMIKLNIKNAVQLPIKTHAQKIAETTRLSSQFPVSSGNQHKQKELEWVPVVPESSKTETKPTEAVVTSTVDISKIAVPPDIPAVSSIPPPPPVPVSYPCPPPVEVPQVEVTTPVSVPVLMPPPMPTFSMPPPLPPPDQSTLFYQMPAQPVMETYVTPNQPMMMSYPSEVVVSSPSPSPSSSSSSIFKPPKKLDIPVIVAKRFQALTKLQENPNDPEALRTLQEAQESIQEWVQSQQVPGLFTGSTDAKVLSAAELCGPFKYHKFRKKIDFSLHEIVVI